MYQAEVSIQWLYLSGDDLAVYADVLEYLQDVARKNPSHDAYLQDILSDQEKKNTFAQMVIY